MLIFHSAGSPARIDFLDGSGQGRPPCPDIVRTGLLRSKSESDDAGETQRKTASGGKTTGSRSDMVASLGIEPRTRGFSIFGWKGLENSVSLNIVLLSSS